MLLIFPTNFQENSNPFHKFQNNYKPNHKSPVEKLQTKFFSKIFQLKVKIYKPLKKKLFKFVFLANLQDVSKFQIIKIFGETQKFLEGQKSKGRIQGSKYFPQLSKHLESQSFYFFAIFFKFWGEPKFYWLCPKFLGQSFF